VKITIADMDERIDEGKDLGFPGAPPSAGTIAGIDQKECSHGWLGDPTDKLLRMRRKNC
jgi:hypothetical protein